MLPKAEELRKKQDEELIEMLAKLNKDRLNQAADSPQKVNNIKKVIARIKTILRERGIKK